MPKRDDTTETFAPNEQASDPVKEMWLEVGKNIDIFTDLDPIVVMALNNCLAYVEKLEEYRVYRKLNGSLIVVQPDPAARIAKWVTQYLRFRASVGRKARTEATGIFTAKNERTRENIHVDGGTQGGKPLR